MQPYGQIIIVVVLRQPLASPQVASTLPRHTVPVLGQSEGGAGHVHAAGVPVQTLIPVHAIHAAPAEPHAAVAFPGWQLVPFQQPMQQAPAWQVPPAHVFVSSLLWPQVPLTQAASVQGFVSSAHDEHAPPADPHAAAVLPG
jgi:hypothetical protein